MKIKALVLAVTVALATTAFAGCSKPATTTTPAPTTTTTPATGTDKADAVAAASLVDDSAVFEKSIDKDGKWIVCLTKDLTLDKDLVVDGDLKNGKTDKETGAELFQRKIALYTQDENKKVTGKFTLTAPSITFNSVNGSLEHGTFKGDVYVAGKNFKLVNQTIEGNLYFLNEEAQKTFTIKDKEDDTKTTITGVQELKADAGKADAVAAASLVDNSAVFEKSIGKDGKWIVCLTKDLTLDKELVVDGDFKNGKKDKETGAELFQRKIALYTQDENKKVTGKFTLTAPSITFNSVNGSLEHGTFKGDVYVAGKNFKLVNQTIEGNIYFLNEEAQKTFTIKDKEDDTKTTITGVQELKK
jgi:hypothetical protein